MAWRSSKKSSAFTTTNLSGQLAKLLGSVCGLLLLGYFFKVGGNFAKTEPEPPLLMDARVGSDAQLRLCGPSSPSGRAVPIQMVYSEDKRPWIEFVAARFSQRCPNIQLKLIAMEDLAASTAILAGELSPTLWAPTDELALGLFQYRAAEAGKATAWHIEEKRELVRSPQVLLIWQDRLRVLSRVLRELPRDEGDWVRSLCAGIPREPVVSGMRPEQMVPGTWLDLYSPLLAPTIDSTSPKRPGHARGVWPIRSELPSLAEDVASWGQVKIVHAIPTRFLGGLSSLYLLSYDYVLKPSERNALAQSAIQPQALTSRLAQAYTSGFVDKKDALRRWLHRCEAGLDTEMRSVDALTESLFSAGPARYDAIVTYEHLTMPFLDKLDAAAGSLKKLVMVYPTPTLVANHPAVRFGANPEQQEAAERWLAFLLSAEMQHKAIEFGFRPGDSTISIRNYLVEQNRFLRLRRFGILPEPVFHEAPRPDGKLLQELMELWGEATGRH